jgi:nucleoside phosphorylase
VAEHVPVAVVLTARQVEFEAFRAYLTNVEERFHPQGTAFCVGDLPGGRRRVALAEIGEGNNGAAVLTERAISFIRPDLLVFVGIAGALMDDLALGDVVVPTRIYLLLSGTVADDGFHRRPRTWQVSHALDQFARHVHRERAWLAGLPAPSPEVHFRPVVAGDLVLDARDTTLARQIREHYNDAAAIEMESAGMAHAAYLNQSLPSIAVRGISDTASGDKEETDKAGWQQRAARNAAAFGAALLAGFPGRDPVTGTPALRLAIAELAKAEAAAGELYRTVHDKIAEPGLPPLAARTPALTGRLDDADRVAREDGRSDRLAGELAELERDIAGARKEVEELHARAAGLLERRRELRSRLENYLAVAVERGFAEAKEIGAGYTRARELLWTKPCDLRAATQAVHDYQRAVIARREAAR